MKNRFEVNNMVQRFLRREFEGNRPMPDGSKYRDSFDYQSDLSEWQRDMDRWTSENMDRAMLDLRYVLGRMIDDRGEREPLETAEVSAQKIARTIDEMLGRGWKFTVVLASSHDGSGGFMTYASNLERSGSVAMLRELADSIEERKEV